MVNVKILFQILKAVQKTVECYLVFKHVPTSLEQSIQVSIKPWKFYMISSLQQRSSKNSRKLKFENFLFAILHSDFSHFFPTVEELTCLAAWKDGNARYLVGLVSHNHANTYEERFRCFVYEKTNNNKYGESRKFIITIMLDWIDLNFVVFSSFWFPAYTV